jgi:N-acyl amino acid synthase of PEP-CTERM/exosortase system
MFTYRRVKNDEELQEVYRLRYQVYCTECGFEDPKDHPEGLEKDDFDEHSAHFVAIDRVGKIIGTVRLVLDSELGFPVEKFCNLEIDTSRIPKDGLGEISRLAISKIYRRRSGDGVYGASDGTKGLEDRKAVDRRRKHPAIVLGLLKALYRESKWRGTVNWYAAMEKPLHILLKRYGFVFNPIGDEVHYHGHRTPYIARIGAIESEIAKRRPELFHLFTDWDRASSFDL